MRWDLPRSALSLPAADGETTSKNGLDDSETETSKASEHSERQNSNDERGRGMLVG